MRMSYKVNNNEAFDKMLINLSTTNLAGEKMKKLLTLIPLGFASLVSADQYNQGYDNMSTPWPSCNSGRGYYQDQPNNGRYYQQNQRLNSQDYYQRDDRNDDRNNPYYYQERSPRNQSYDQNQQYYPQRNQSYNWEQQRNDDNVYGFRDNNNQRMTSDEEINKKIHETLNSGWFSKGFQNVSFDVRNGNVNLRGSVDTLENKNKVEDSVRKIDGVKQVSNQITIAKESSDNYSDSQLQNSERKYTNDFASNSQDRQLNAKIRDQLSNGWFSEDYEMLIIRTTNGAVIISGTVDKPEDIQKINDQIRSIEGVKSVNNQLMVKNR